MLEDDVVAQREWYEHTLRSLRTVMIAREEESHRTIKKNWLYLRLFYTEKFLGWNAEERPTYLVWSLIAVSTPALIGVYARRKVRSLQGTLTNSFLVVVCLVCCPMATILYFLAGRVTVQPLRPGVHVMNRHGCCSQALLFPREKVPLLIDHLHHYLQTTKTTSKLPRPVDSVIEMFADQGDFDRFAISPSQMQHAGAASYKENRKSFEWEGPYPVRGAHGVWSMGFEKAYE